MFIAWAVLYRDGTVTHCADKNDKDFKVDPQHPWGGEVPFKAIRWAEVDELAFSGNTGEVSSYLLGTPAEGYEYKMVSRVFMTPGYGEQRWFILAEVKLGETPSDDNVHSVLYWCEDGTDHTCYKFNCPDVAKYSVGKNLGNVSGLMPHSDALQVDCTATLS